MKNRIFVSIIMAALLFMMGCGANTTSIADVTSNPESEQPAETEVVLEDVPEETAEAQPEDTSATTFGSLTFELCDVSNGTGTAVVAQMAKATATKAEMQAFTESEFIDLCDTVVKPLMDDGCNYVTIDFGDGTGIVFTGGLAHYPTYGEIDETGAVTKGIGDITCKDGTVTYEAR